jgi:hypothetical protein
MLADDDCVQFFAAKMSKDLRALAIKPFTKLHVARNWVRPPVAFDVSIVFDVGHEAKFPEL